MSRIKPYLPLLLLVVVVVAVFASGVTRYLNFEALQTHAPKAQPLLCLSWKVVANTARSVLYLILAAKKSAVHRTTSSLK